jgi:hypothetical protein
MLSSVLDIFQATKITVRRHFLIFLSCTLRETARIFGLSRAAALGYRPF